MKKINPIILVTSIILMLITNINYAQSTTTTLNLSEKERDQFNFKYSGESRISYYEFNEYIVRIEDNTIQLIDENIQVIDELEIPRTNENSDLITKISESKLYIIEKLRKNYREMEGTKIYEIDLFDLSSYRQIEIPTESAHDIVSLITLKDKAFVSVSEKGVLKTFFQIGANGNTEYNLDKYFNEYSEGGVWRAPIVYNNQIVLTAANTSETDYITHTITFDENMKILDESTQLINNESRQITTLDKNEETVSEKDMGKILEDVPPYSLKVNNKTIWIKNTYTYKGMSPIPKIETWVSYDEFKFEINLSEHLKKEMGKAGMKKSTGMAAPIIYKDPVNNSIIVQYWKMVIVNGRQIENFFYFNLNSRFMMRNAYKVKLTRFPIAGYGAYNQMMAAATQIMGTAKSFTFGIDNTAKKWEGNIVDSSSNAFDLLFSQKRVDGLCTVVDAKNIQYLFIDKKDGSTVAHVFKRED